MRREKKIPKSMFYRRKIILALFQILGGTISRQDFQKLLFLFTKNQKLPSFHFLPYRSGCFSAQADQDIKTMIKYGFIQVNSAVWIKKTDTDFMETLRLPDRISIQDFYSEFKDMNGESLTEYVSKNFPDYAVRSEMVLQIMTETERLEPALFTIGYEGSTVEMYVTKLLNENIKVLCDVRKNPVSMKFGFSKSQLKNILENVGIDYMHFPDLGIESDKRKNLKEQMDYKKLFTEYEKIILPKMKIHLLELADVCRKSRRAALTCFEKDPAFCHRSRTAAALTPFLPDEFSVEHL